MANKDTTFRVKGEIYKGEDGRYMVLETKTGEHFDVLNEVEEFVGKSDVTLTIKESKKVSSQVQE